jgi:hypothetical protein
MISCSFECGESVFRTRLIIAFFMLLGAAGFATSAHAAAELSLPEIPFTAPFSPNECRKPSNGGDAEQCERIDRATMNVLFQKRGICRWIDNSNGHNDYFLPYNTQPELDSFLLNPPDGVGIDTCCMPTRKIVGQLADGRDVAITTPLGRSYHAGSGGTLNQAAKTFSVPVFLQTCKTHRNGQSTCNTCNITQNVIASATCDGSGWNVDANISTPAACSPPPPLNCPAAANGGTYWQQTGSTSWNQSCPDTYSGGIACTGTTMAEMLCDDGLSVPTGNVRIDNQSCTNTCTPPPPPPVCIPQGQAVPYGQQQCPTAACFLQVSGGAFVTPNRADGFLYSPVGYTINNNGVLLDNIVGRGDYPLSSPADLRFNIEALFQPPNYPIDDPGTLATYPLIRASYYTFDGIAIGSTTRVTIYAGPNFTGGVLFDAHGPYMLTSQYYWTWAGQDQSDWSGWGGMYAQFTPDTRHYEGYFDGNVFGVGGMRSWGRGTSIRVQCD